MGLKPTYEKNCSNQLIERGKTMEGTSWLRWTKGLIDGLGN